MRIERAIDAYLDWRQLERDATPRSVASYRRILFKLAEEYPEIEVGTITTGDLRSFLAAWVRDSKAERGIDLSASTRSNIISVLHSFFGWAESEDLVDVDPSRKIRRPPKRKPDIYRPSVPGLAKLRAAAVGHERAPILLMEGVGLRRSEVLGCRWEDIDLERQRIRVRRKGRHWQWVPVDPDVVAELRICVRELEPEPGDHVFHCRGGAVGVAVRASAPAKGCEVSRERASALASRSARQRASRHQDPDSASAAPRLRESVSPRERPRHNGSPAAPGAFATRHDAVVHRRREPR
jgi:site-specific recombinase XerC